MCVVRVRVRLCSARSECETITREREIDRGTMSTNKLGEEKRRRVRGAFRQRDVITKPLFFFALLYSSLLVLFLSRSSSEWLLLSFFRESTFPRRRSDTWILRERNVAKGSSDRSRTLVEEEFPSSSVFAIFDVYSSLFY